MAIKLSAPPVRVPIVDKNGNMTPDWQRWFTLLHLKTGGASPVLPVSLGGTGGDNIIDVLAVQASSSSSSATDTSTTVSNSKTERQTFVLASPPSDALGDFSETVCVWSAPFTDANYRVTANFLGTNGRIDLGVVTAQRFTLRLINTTYGEQAAGSADCIGVHP